MVAKTYIQNNLTQINNLYQKSTSQKHALFYSKLAILELCGWIEESMDDIVRKCAKQHLKNLENLTFVEANIIKRTYSFVYDPHFRNMLMQLLGIINLEKLEHNLDIVKFHLMKSTLDTLKTCRDSEAHTHLKGTTKRLDAPSVTQSRFHVVYDGLEDFEDCIRGMRI